MLRLRGRMAPDFYRFRVLSIVAAVAVTTLGCSSASRMQSSGAGSADQRSGKSGRHASSRGELTGELARLTVERDRLAQANMLLEQELAETHEDLRRVEQQFVVYEENLLTDQGKAAAVAAAAEARIRIERVEREHPHMLSDSTRAYARSLIETSERLIRKQNYPAALFFAERANHTVSSAERRATIEGAATTRFVAVDVANLREGPGQDYAVVERLSVGAKLLCWGEANEWFHVRTPTGAEGWIHVSLIR